MKLFLPFFQGARQFPEWKLQFRQTDTLSEVAGQGRLLLLAIHSCQYPVQNGYQESVFANVRAETTYKLVSML